MQGRRKNLIWWFFSHYCIHLIECSFQSQVSVLQRLEQLPFDGSCDWDTPLSAWRYYQEIIVGKTEEQSTQSDSQILTSTAKPDDSQTDDNPSDSSEDACLDPSTKYIPSAANEKPVTFRVTCTRGGGKHSFTSMDAARCFGAGLARRFSWIVRLKNPELEVLLTIMGESMMVAIALNQESKYKRNIAHFGPTTLRSTIAYGLLRYVKQRYVALIVQYCCRLVVWEEGIHT